jgi:hypothetical protein
MNNEHHFYGSNGQRGGISAETLAAAGITLPAAKGALALEDELITAMGYDKAVTIIREAWKTGVLEATVCIKLQRALDAFYTAQALADFPAEPGEDFDPRGELCAVQ